MAADVSLATNNASYLSGSIKWSGLASGTDFGSVVDQLIEIERTNINRQELWRSEWEEKITSIQGLNTRMYSLKLNAQDLDTYSEFYTRSSSSSSDSIVTVTNTSIADEGTHTVVVGQNIPGQLISTSYQDGVAVGGTGDLVITVGSQTLTIPEGDGTGGTWDPTGDIEDLAAQIDAADTGDLLGDIYTVVDKTRSGDTYKRLVITAQNGGSDNLISATDPTNLSLDSTTVDAVYNKTWLGSTSAATSGGTYTGSTNKTFTFAAANTGVLGQDDVVIKWADNEGNTGEIELKADEWTDATDYDVFQGVTVRFGAGRIIKAESFIIDAFHPTFQQGQDEGLAQAEKQVHDGFADLITEVHDSGTGYFAYRYEGVLTTVSVGGGATLQDLVNAINNDPDNRGVVASIVDDGQGSSTSYHLILTGQNTGAEHTIEIVDPTSLPEPLTALSNFDVVGTFSTAQRAQDSMVKLDGFPATDYKYIQRSSNTIADVIDGVVLDVHDSGTATITISADTTAIKEKITQFVNSVNFVLDYIRDETSYDSETGESGVMIGNYTYDIIRNAVNGIFSDSIPGLDRDTDVYTHLSQIGIKTDPDQDGMWVVENSVLDNALKNNLEAVALLFVKDEEHGTAGSLGVAEQLRVKMEELTDSETGIGVVLIDNYNQIIKDIDQKIAREERRIALVKDRLEEKFARLETLLSQLNGQSTYLESQLDNLPSVGKK
jgi:flagellar capping protein FliD